MFVHTDEEINAVVGVLYANEDNLSDGYQYYNDNPVEETLRAIAIKILDAAKEARHGSDL